MSSSLAATELVAIEALQSGITLASVYQDVPEDTAPPVVILGDLDGSPLGETKDDDMSTINLTVTTVTEGDERKPCLDIIGEVETVLADLDVEQDGWRLVFKGLGSNAALTPDGLGYVGTSTFEVLALKAA